MRQLLLPGNLGPFCALHAPLCAVAVLLPSVKEVSYNAVLLNMFSLDCLRCMKVPKSRGFVKDVIPNSC